MDNRTCIMAVPTIAAKPVPMLHETVLSRAHMHIRASGCDSNFALWCTLIELGACNIHMSTTTFAGAAGRGKQGLERPPPLLSTDSWHEHLAQKSVDHTCDSVTASTTHGDIFTVFCQGAARAYIRYIVTYQDADRQAMRTRIGRGMGGMVLPPPGAQPSSIVAPLAQPSRSVRAATRRARLNAVAGTAAAALPWGQVSSSAPALPLAGAASGAFAVGSQTAANAMPGLARPPPGAAAGNSLVGQTAVNAMPGLAPPPTASAWGTNSLWGTNANGSQSATGAASNNTGFGASGAAAGAISHPAFLFGSQAGAGAAPGAAAAASANPFSSTNGPYSNMPAAADASARTAKRKVPASAESQFGTHQVAHHSVAAHQGLAPAAALPTGAQAGAAGAGPQTNNMSGQTDDDDVQLQIALEMSLAEHDSHGSRSVRRRHAPRAYTAPGRRAAEDAAGASQAAAMPGALLPAGMPAAQAGNAQTPEAPAPSLHTPKSCAAPAGTSTPAGAAQAGAGPSSAAPPNAVATVSLLTEDEDAQLARAIAASMGVDALQCTARWYAEEHRGQATCKLWYRQ